MAACPSQTIKFQTEGVRGRSWVVLGWDPDRVELVDEFFLAVLEHCGLVINKGLQGVRRGQLGIPKVLTNGKGR